MKLLRPIRNRKLSCLIFSLLILFSCSKEETLIKVEDENNIDIGAYYLLQESIDKLPYKDKEQVVFADSSNNTVIFEIIERELFQTYGTLYKYDVFEQGDTVKYDYSSQGKMFTLKNDLLNVQFDFSLEAKPYRQDPESQFVADVINIFCVDPDPEIYARQVFYLVVDQRTWPTFGSPPPIDEIAFIGNIFYEVFNNNFSNPKSIVYFNYEFGVVSFTDMNGKLWRFESW